MISTLWMIPASQRLNNDLEIDYYLGKIRTRCRDIPQLEQLTVDLRTREKR